MDAQSPYATLPLLIHKALFADGPWELHSHVGVLVLVLVVYLKRKLLDL
jgi:hypothetical protein